MIGASLAGWEEVVGVEQSSEYIAIGEARRKFWSCNVALFEELTAPDKTEALDPQGDLFAEGD